METEIIEKEEVDKLLKGLVKEYKQTTLPFRITKWASVGLIGLNMINIMIHENTFDTWASGLGFAYLCLMATGVSLVVAMEGIIDFYKKDLAKTSAMLFVATKKNSHEYFNFTEKVEGYGNDKN